MVVVIEEGQLLQPQVAGEADRLVTDALHQVTVRADHPRAVIDQRLAEARRQHPFGQGHADRRCDPLTERAGCGLDSRRLAVFRMPGGGRLELAEVPDVIDAHALEAGEIEQGVEQHGAVTGGQHEAVAVGPVRIGGVELQEARPQHGCDVGHPHRQARMPGIGRLHRINRQRPDGIGHSPLLGDGSG